MYASCADFLEADSQVERVDTRSLLPDRKQMHSTLATRSQHDQHAWKTSQLSHDANQILLGEGVFRDEKLVVDTMYASCADSF